LTRLSKKNLKRKEEKKDETLGIRTRVLSSINVVLTYSAPKYNWTRKVILTLCTHFGIQPKFETAYVSHCLLILSYKIHRHIVLTTDLTSANPHQQKKQCRELTIPKMRGVLHFRSSLEKKSFALCMLFIFDLNTCSARVIVVKSTHKVIGLLSSL
jgi:hypothetical protein